MADERDTTAAEYVIGTLPEAERAAAAARLQSDPAFAAAVRAWEDRLAPLDRETAPVPPPEKLWERVKAAIETEAVVPRVDLGARLADAAGPVAEVIDLTRRLSRWRVTAVAALALAAGLAAVAAVDRMPGLLPFLDLAPAPAGGRYVAVVNRDAALPALIVDVDTASGQVTVRPVSAERPAGKSLELWVIPDGGAPRSLGLVDPAARVLEIAADKVGPIPAKGLFAITVEPPGGSPTGAPSGAPVYAGQLIPVN